MQNGAFFSSRDFNIDFGGGRGVSVPCYSVRDCRVHRSHGDSRQNEAEKTNYGCGDALVDGGTLEWEKFKRFDGMSNEDTRKMDMKEFEGYESNRMEKNAWAVAEELQR